MPADLRIVPTQAGCRIELIALDFFLSCKSVAHINVVVIQFNFEFVCPLFHVFVNVKLKRREKSLMYSGAYAVHINNRLIVSAFKAHIVRFFGIDFGKLKFCFIYLLVISAGTAVMRYFNFFPIKNKIA